MFSGSAIKVNTPGMKISIKSKIARRIHIAESRSDNQFRYIEKKTCTSNSHPYWRLYIIV